MPDLAPLRKQIQLAAARFHHPPGGSAIFMRQTAPSQKPPSVTDHIRPHHGTVHLRGGGHRGSGAMGRAFLRIHPAGRLPSPISRLPSRRLPSPVSLPSPHLPSFTEAFQTQLGEAPLSPSTKVPSASPLAAPAVREACGVHCHPSRVATATATRLTAASPRTSTLDLELHSPSLNVCVAARQLTHNPGLCRCRIVATGIRPAPNVSRRAC
jgi:hypothetical protein